jgi:hypothetical protein
MTFDDNIFYHEACLSSGNEEREFFKCFYNDLKLAQEISRALSSTDLHNTQFAFFNMNLSEWDKYNLQEFSSCLDFAALDIVADLDNVYSETVGYISFLCPKISTEISHNLANMVTRFASSIVAASNYTDAEVILKTYGNDPKWVLDRHIDKTHQEMSSNERNNSRAYSNNQYVFLLPLIGKTTMFFPVSAEKKVKFEQLAHETFVSRGEAYSPNQMELNALFNSSEVYSPKLGYGSVHIAGQNGTIHAKPDTEGGRFIVTVIPNDHSSLIKFKSFIEESFA